MFGYIIIMLCAQACFIQDVRSNPLGVTGGHGHGNIAVGGKLGVSGRTCVSGSVPVCGAVEFGGKVPAAGCVTIAGKCSCGHH